MRETDADLQRSAGGNAQAAVGARTTLGAQRAEIRERHSETSTFICLNSSYLNADNLSYVGLGCGLQLLLIVVRLTGDERRHPRNSESDTSVLWGVDDPLSN